MSFKKAVDILKANYGKIISVSFVIAYIFHTSCANTHGAPTGGPRDSIPPVVLSTIPDSGTIMFPLTGGKIMLTFDEYIQLKDAQKNILLSPPQTKKPQTKIKGKNLIISFEESLDSNKTYTLYFGSALADNNEGNILQNYTFSFSTGKTIDSMLISGIVMNNQDLTPLEGISIALYKSDKDSALMTTLPNAICKSDKWGYFALQHLEDTTYRMYAFKDENNNNMYDQGIEMVAFLDSAITPNVVMRRGMRQTARLDMKDTAACLARPVEYELYMFYEKNQRQYISSYDRLTNKGAYIKFSSPDAQIDSFSIKGIRSNQIIKQFNPTNDSLSFWINDPRTLPDTLYLGIKYGKTDSLGNLVPTVENLKLIAPIKTNDEKKKDEKQKEDKRSDLLEFQLTGDPKNVEHTGIILAFKEPLIEYHLDSITLTMSTPRRVVTQEEYAFTQDSLNINTYYIRPATDFKIGNDYQLNIRQAAFKDVNGFTNDSVKLKLALPTDDNLSSITLDVTNVKARYIVELLDDKRSKVFRKYVITCDSLLLFPYLSAGKYSVRITEDKNNNGILDPGIYLKRIQPEMVRLYKLYDGSSIIDLPEKTDLEQSVNVGSLFNVQ